MTEILDGDHDLWGRTSDGRWYARVSHGDPFFYSWATDAFFLALAQRVRTQSTAPVTTVGYSFYRTKHGQWRHQSGELIDMITDEWALRCAALCVLEL